MIVIVFLGVNIFMMGKIFLLMGKSASGKDSIYRTLIRSEELGLKKVVPYTTRPVRDGETDGVQYFFKGESEYIEFRENKKIIEERTYHTRYGEWRYFTADDGQIDLKNGNYLVIGTLESFINFRDYFGYGNVIPLYICVSDRIRLKRAMLREESQEHPKYDEMCRRYLADEADFSEEKLTKEKIDPRFDNSEDIDKCIGKISEYITKWISE